MKTTLQLSILAVLGLSVAAQAAPTVGPMGPSAKMAAKLKKSPAPSWLAHYLPDDRYKIAGGIWKFVSTDLDTYVHLPNSPLMLRQSAGSVIGFASIADAEEAGYTPEPGLTANARFAMPRGMEAPSKPLSKQEIDYLTKFTRFMSALTDKSLLPAQRGMPIPAGDVARFVIHVQSAAQDLRKTSIPSRFSEAGKNFNQSIDGMFSHIDEWKTGDAAAHEKLLKESIISLIVGTVQIEKSIGRENFSRYVSIPGMPKP